MKNSYSIDLDAVSLSEYEKELKQAELLPSRKMIQEDIKKRFGILAGNGMQTLQDLLDALKTFSQIKKFSKRTGLPEQYLAVLKREISSFRPKPVDLKDFIGIPQAAVQKLGKMNIKNTKQFFSYCRTEENRKALCQQTGIAYPVILELTKLTDVARIRWVGANFARLFVDSAYDTSAKISRADYQDVYQKTIEILEQKKYFKGKFGLNDMKLCVLAAKKVPLAIKY